MSRVDQFKLDFEDWGPSHAVDGRGLGSRDREIRAQIREDWNDQEKRSSHGCGERNRKPCIRPLQELANGSVENIRQQPRRRAANERNSVGGRKKKLTKLGVFLLWKPEGRCSEINGGGRSDYPGWNANPANTPGRRMMDYETRTLSILVAPKDQPTFSEYATKSKSVDEAAGNSSKCRKPGGLIWENLDRPGGMADVARCH